MKHAALYVLSFLRRNISFSVPSNHRTAASLTSRKKTAKKRSSCEPVQIAIVLCGCGALDGTEVSEAMSVTINVCQRGMKPRFFAPDVKICNLMNHYTNEPETGPPRNALVEGARLARSSIKPFSQCEICTYGALIIPGGFGVARTLSDFASKGTDCTVLPDFANLIEGFYCEKKPIGAVCIASAIVAKVLKGVKVTLGKDSPKEDWPYAEAIQRVKDMGAKIEMKDSKGITHCKTYNVFSTPAWMHKRATYGGNHAAIGKMIDMIQKRIQ